MSDFKKIATVILTAIFPIGCALIYDRGPYYLLPPITVEFYECEKCNSYVGGIFGKGPLLKYKSESAKRCIHHWEKTTASRFEEEVRSHFQIDLQKDEWFQKIKNSSVSEER
ncbi:hypothetical protein JWG45_20660 [Leptospira sp. 201903070]|jgi:hypothetical protein|uniref:Lipoprotein n=1 Tax=Leptospira ainlahdjerensis TaxID=2810033 RepID=A0ABS2UGR9_9LEPT|nr:hypothetical protein [Leptospira ainlahdjerensis]MBM9579561.1 hypothetical protein [Leptospira ainlahdjerensis]